MLFDPFEAIIQLNVKLFPVFILIDRFIPLNSSFITLFPKLFYVHDAPFSIRNELAPRRTEVKTLRSDERK